MARPIGTASQRPVIGVTGNSKSFSPSWLCIRLVLFLSGARPLRIRVGQAVDLSTVDGLIISGGDDIYPGLYGENPEEGASYDRERDAMEIECIDHALHIGIPMLGICRGHQLINTVMGGTLHLSVRAMRSATSNRRSLIPKKKVRLRSSSILAEITGRPALRVNSLHNQAISSVAPELTESALDNDDIIQAVESNGGQPIIGVQWHPEYLFVLPEQFRLFRWLVRKAQAYALSEKKTT